MNSVKAILEKGIYRVLFLSMLFSVTGAFFQASAADTWEWTIATKGAANSIATTQGKTDVYTVILNEVYANPDASKAEKEFVELYNYGSEDVSLSGWSLSNKSGAKYVIKDDVTIGAKGYVVLERSVTLSNTGDTLTLTSADGTERDTIEYAKGDLVKGQSLGRFCDVYELLFCSLEATPRTPGAMNSQDVLEVHSDHRDGTYPRGTKIVFTSSLPGADIYYSQDATNPDPESQIKYTHPIVLDGDMDLLFYAVKEGRSSKIEELHLRVEKGVQRLKNYGIKINEVYMGSGSLLDMTSWVELTSTAQKKVDVSGWVLSTEKQGTCLKVELCLKMDDGLLMYPKSFRIFELSSEMQASRSFYLLDAEGNLVDEVHLYDFEAGQSFARYNNPQRIFTTREVPALYGVTDFPTKAKENIIAQTSVDDKDGDLLDTHAEEFFETLPSRFDTNKNGLPDFYDKGHDMTEGFQKYFYKKLLADLVTIHAENGVLQGKTIPSAVITVYGTSDELIGQTKSDMLGDFTWTPETFTSLPLYLTITDRNGVESFASEGFMFTVNATEQMIAMNAYPVEITALLPNPDGKDTKNAEWIELHNTASQELDLQGMIFVMNDKESRIKEPMLIQAGEKKKIFAEVLSRGIPNTGMIQLKSPQGVLIDSVEYTDPGAGEVITVLQETKKVSVNTAKSTQKVTTKSVSKAPSRIVNKVSVAAVPSLKEVAISEASPVPADYAVEAMVQGEVIPSEQFAASSPADAEKNVVLALLGGFMSTMSGFIFWKF